MHREDRVALRLTEWPWRDPPTERVNAELDQDWSRLRTDELGRMFWSFRVMNAEKQHEYEVDLFVGLNGEPCAYCTCPAALPCKHIKAALIDLYYICPEFGLDYADTLFFEGYFTYVGALADIVARYTSTTLEKLREVA